MKLGALPIPRAVWDTADPAKPGAGNDPAKPGAGDPAKPGAGDPPPKPGASALERGAAGDPPPADPPAALPENWRELLAADNQDVLTELKRFKSPTDFANAHLETKRALRKGGLGSDEPAPDGEKDPEGLKKWREARGIPDDPAGYKLDEKVAKRLLDEDKPILETFQAAAHKANMPQSVIDFTSAWYVDMMEQTAAHEANLDKEHGEAAEEALREEWGPDYKRNMQVAKRFSDSTIEGVNWFDARLPNDPERFGDNAGKKLGSIPEVVKGLVELGLLKHGDGDFIDGETSQKSDSRIAEIEQIIATDLTKYTPAMRKEYMELLAAKERATAAKSR